MYKRKSMKQEYITDTILTNTIAALNEQISALQSALDNLQATVNSKVSQDDFNSLQSVVNTKASQSSLDSLSNTVSGKANSSDVYSKFEINSTVYSKSEVNSLLNDKADNSTVSSLQSTVNNKANQSDLNNVSGRVSTIEGQYVKSSNIRTITKMTSSEYASSSKDANTAYFVTD